MTAATSAPFATVSCPHCAVAVAWRESRFRPFCSERCRMIDLGAWIDESYRVPEAVEHSDEESS